MITGRNPIGLVPLGSGGTALSWDTGDTAEIVLVGGTPEVHSIISVTGTSAAITLSGGRTRVILGSVGTTAGVTLSGGEPSIGSIVVPSVAAVTLTGGSTTLASIIFPSVAEFTLTGGDGQPGIGIRGETAELTLSGGDASPGVSAVTASAVIAFSGGQAQIGSGAVGNNAAISISGGAVTIKLGPKVPTAQIWFSGGVVAEIAETAQGIVVVLNANTLAVSEYSISALDAIVFDGELYFVQADGLVKLAAGTADSAAIVKTGMLNLGADEKKYVPGLRATLAGDSTTTVTVTIELDGDSRDLGPYELVGRSGPASFVRKWKLAGGVKVDNLALTLNGSGGTDWKLQGLSVSAELL